MNTNRILKQGLGVAGDVAGEARRMTMRVVGPARGLLTRVQSALRKDLPDPTITRKVESIVFRDPRFPKNKIAVNTVDGVVYVRGTLKHPAEIRALEAAVLAIPEVKDVENLVTQPKTPRKAPRARFQKPGEKPARRGQISDDRTDEIVDVKEATPREKAAKREGRTPAPLGAEGEGTRTGGSDASGGARGRATAPSQRRAAGAGPAGTGAGAKPTGPEAPQPADADRDAGAPDEPRTLPWPTV
jgi:hypothetical protein